MNRRRTIQTGRARSVRSYLTQGIGERPIVRAGLHNLTDRTYWNWSDVRGLHPMIRFFRTSLRRDAARPQPERGLVIFRTMTGSRSHATQEI